MYASGPVSGMHVIQLLLPVVLKPILDRGKCPASNVRPHTAYPPVRTQHEFVYHHARRDFVMLVRWLPRHEVDQIPPYAHSMVGVGGIVIAEDRGEVLVVREKYYKQPHWKLPGGFVEPGEQAALLGGAVMGTQELLSRPRTAPLSRDTVVILSASSPLRL